jgi:hypothetical protein
MQDFQENTTEPYPLFLKEDYHEEINHPCSVVITEQHDEEQNFHMGHVYDDYESNPWESQEEEEEQQEEQFISCSEPFCEQPPPKISQTTPASHLPVLAKYIQQCVSSCVVEEAAYYKFFRIYYSFYEPVNEYMEWHFLHVLELPYFISTSSFEGELKGVTILLSQLHQLLVIIDRVKELPFRKLLD